MKIDNKASGEMYAKIARYIEKHEHLSERILAAYKEILP